MNLLEMKLAFESTVKRLLLPEKLSDLINIISSNFNLNLDSFGKDFSIVYLDNDNDYIDVANENDFQYMRSFATNTKAPLVKLHIIHKEHLEYLNQNWNLDFSRRTRLKKYKNVKPVKSKQLSNKSPVHKNTRFKRRKIRFTTRRVQKKSSIKEIFQVKKEEARTPTDCSQSVNIIIQKQIIKEFLESENTVKEVIEKEEKCELREQCPKLEIQKMLFLNNESKLHDLPDISRIIEFPISTYLEDRMDESKEKIIPEDEPSFQEVVYEPPIVQEEAKVSLDKPKKKKGRPFKVKHEGSNYKESSAQDDHFFNVTTHDEGSPQKGKSIFSKEKKFKYKNNLKSDDGKIEKWFLNARYLLRQYKKTEDKDSSYVITYEGKNKIKVQFRIRGPDRKFKCSGKLVHFPKEGYDEKWDMETGVSKMESFLNFALENFETLEKHVNLFDY